MPRVRRLLTVPLLALACLLPAGPAPAQDTAIIDPRATPPAPPASQDWRAPGPTAPGPAVPSPSAPGAGTQTPAAPAPGVPPQGTLGTIPGDFELHGELVLVGGQLEGFHAACGFGLRPDRAELMRWYQYNRLARNPGRMEVIYDLGISLGREGPCTADHYKALETQWTALMSRTQNYVATYRR
ncbi:MAG TPA: hypothetical protein VED40_11625 [Azospirillaceae bacterium]|nr:hypothetical protein [Azospirillaceae bacterium]